MGWARVSEPFRSTFEMTEQPERIASAEPYGILAIAWSAGGISALGRVLGELPVELPVPVVIVRHLDPRHETIIAEVIGRRTKLAVKLAAEGEQAEVGNVYIAPPNRHLLVGVEGVMSLTSSELVHYVRPSADCCSSPWRRPTDHARSPAY